MLGDGDGPVNVLHGFVSCGKEMTR
jgi:hypothetical protein